MEKKILITGATDGIGFATAQSLLENGHTVLIHGRNEEKLAAAKTRLLALFPSAHIETYAADLSVLAQVQALADSVRDLHTNIDVLINNAGVYVVPEAVSEDGLDLRFAVNTIAPYLLTQRLLPLIGNTGRVINLSSAAQAPVNPHELATPSELSDGEVYAKSKLALTMWSRHMAASLQNNGPAIIAVNPGSLLGSKMVKQAYGVTGGNLQKGADILVRLALSEKFSDASGIYYDNDSGQITDPHRDALNAAKIAEVTQAIENILARHF